MLHTVLISACAQGAETPVIQTQQQIMIAHIPLRRSTVCRWVSIPLFIYKTSIPMSDWTR